MNRNTFIKITVVLALMVLGLASISFTSKQPPSTYHIPDTPDAKEVMKAIEKAYDIQAEAAYTFDLSKFPTVFINDPRFPVSRGTLKTIRELTRDPSWETAGWLDYKLAYYSWMTGAILHSEAIREKAKIENRSLTKEEIQSLIDPQGRTAPARAENPTRKRQLRFLSVTINGDIAKVILDDGPGTIELTLVLVDKQWYIAGLKSIAFHP